MVEPNRVTDQIRGKTVPLVGIHPTILFDQRPLICQHPLQLEVDDI